MAQAVSDYWRNQIGARELVGRVELINEAGVAIGTTDLKSQLPIKVTHASITQDKTRNVRGSATCQLLIPWDASQEMLDLLPTTPGSPLSPIGGISFRLSAGFTYTALGFSELCYCGRYDIDECEVTETANGVLVDLSGTDLMGRLDAADMWYGLDIAWGLTILFAAELLVTQVIPWMTFREDWSPQSAGRWVSGEKSNRLQNLNYMMAVLGWEAYMDMDGMSMRMRVRPTTLDTAAWVYSFEELGEVIRLTNKMDKSKVYNGVIASGENVMANEPPVRAEAWITDPADPTHYDPFNPGATQIGPRPYFLTSPWILTTADAQNAADSELRRIRGLLQQVQLTVPVNPAINVGDVIDVTRPSMGVVGRYLVESLSFSLDSSLMTLTCEERRV